MYISESLLAALLGTYGTSPFDVKLTHNHLMPPFLDPENTKVDGLAFLGLSLARKSAHGHADSQTHQTAFDLDSLTDRDYQHVISTNDDGWLVGGGEPQSSYKLPAPDSAVVSLMHIGTFDARQGGLSRDQLLQAFVDSKILVPEMTVVPTSVVSNASGDLQLRFDMESAYHETEPNSPVPPLPVNWQLRFIHNQLFRHFLFPSRYCPDPFHCSIAKAVEFRSLEARREYFRKANEVVSDWRNVGPKPLLPPLIKNIERIRSPAKRVRGGMLGSSDKVSSGIWLFRDRHTPTHLVEPNFLPPYDTPEKREIIFDVLSEEWDAHQRLWIPAPPLPKPRLISDHADQSATTTGWACGVVESALCAAGM